MHPQPDDSPWRTPGFRALFTASALTQLGNNIGQVALPLIAVTALGAGPGQVGALTALASLAFLLVGLPAGAWVDRMRQRRVLVVADLARAVLLATVPAARALDALTLWHLYAVAFLGGCAMVFFDVANQSVLPAVVGRGALVRANSAVVSLMAAANIAGRGAGGFLVQLLTAPVAVAVSAAGHLGSALRLCSLPEPPRPPARTAGRLRAQIAEGVRHVWSHAELRALMLTAGLANTGSTLITTMLPVVLVKELGLPAGALGLFGATGGVGILIGARCARPVAARLGHGRTLGLAGLVLAPAGLLVPLVGRGWLWIAGAGWLLVLFKTGIDNVLGVSLRQRMTPDALLGRMNATFRFVLTGAMAVGAALSGLVGQLAGTSAALWSGGVLLALAFLPVYLSPLRTRRELPAPLEVRGPATNPVRHGV